MTSDQAMMASVETVTCDQCGAPIGQACMNGVREEPYPAGWYHKARLTSALSVVISRAQTAEDVGARYTSSAALQNAVVDRLAVAEERVRMLETAAKAALDEAWGFAGSTCSEFCVHGEDRKESCPMNSQALKALETALAKAAGGQEGTR